MLENKSLFFANDYFKLKQICICAHLNFVCLNYQSERSVLKFLCNLLIYLFIHCFQLIDVKTMLMNVFMPLYISFIFLTLSQCLVILNTEEFFFCFPPIHLFSDYLLLSSYLFSITLFFSSKCVCLGNVLLDICLFSSESNHKELFMCLQSRCFMPFLYKARQQIFSVSHMIPFPQFCHCRIWSSKDKM